MPLGNHLRQSFHNGTLAYARFTDENRIILFSSSEYLDDSLYFFLTSYYGIEQPFHSGLGEVGTKLVEHGRFPITFLRASDGITYWLLHVFGRIVRRRIILLLLFVVLVRESNTILRVDTFLIS